MRCPGPSNEPDPLQEYSVETNHDHHVVAGGDGAECVGRHPGQLEGNPAQPAELVPLTADTYLTYRADLFARARAYVEQNQ